MTKGHFELLKVCSDELKKMDFTRVITIIDSILETEYQEMERNCEVCNGKTSYRAFCTNPDCKNYAN